LRGFQVPERAFAPAQDEPVIGQRPARRNLVPRVIVDGVLESY
jgi:hypothetical protein